MRSRLVVVAVLGGCGVHIHTESPPDAPPPYAPPPYMPPAPDYCVNAPVNETASCVDGVASTNLYLNNPGSTPHNSCVKQLAMSTAQCSAGCAVTSTLNLPFATLGGMFTFGNDAAVLCAETPEATAGDACTTDGYKPCLPTRAHLNTDGTVAGQSYLACGPVGVCIAAPAPVITSYLQPCDSVTLSTYGMQGVNGYVGECLLAWDDATQSVTSGITQICVGDWQCPAGSLCDDQVTPIASTTTTVAFCKPGPRGVLTPAMLSH